MIEHTEKNCTRWVEFFPLQLVDSPTRIGKQLQLVTHRQSYLTTPLIRRGYVAEVIDRVLKYLKNNRACPGVMHWPLMNVGGPVFQALVDMTRRDLLGMHVRDSYNRALLKPWHGPDTESACQEYLLQSLGGHHFRELRRQRRRLHESGVLEYRTLENAAELPVWIDWFLQLEASGWKGADSTALASRPETLQFAREMIAAGYEQGRVQMVGLFRNGQPIALKLNLVSSTGGFAYKITYSEEYAKLSPGVQLEIDYLKSFQHSGRSWMDSCAVADHSMINRLWADRRTIQDTLISTGRWTSDRSLLTEQNLEGFYSDKHRNLTLDPSRRDDCWTFDLQPGVGLHFPVTYPHWVQNQNEVSVSFSITFRTPDLDKRRALYSINHQLRARGFSPTPVGQNTLRDAMFFQWFRIWRKLTSRQEASCSRTCRGN